MDIEKEIMELKEIIQSQQNRIADLDNQLRDFNKELVGINDEMYSPGKNGYPSLYDAKEILVQKGWLKKPKV